MATYDVPPNTTVRRVRRLDEHGEPVGEWIDVPGVKTVTVEGVPFDVVRHITTLSLVQAGKCFGFGRTKSYELYHKGEFPVPVRAIAGSLRVRLKDLEDFFDQT